MPPKKSNHAKADVVGGRRVKKRKSDHEDNSATAQSPLVQELDGAVSDRAGNAVARRDNQGNDMVLTRGAALRTKVQPSTFAPVSKGNVKRSTTSKYPQPQNQPTNRHQPRKHN